MRPTESRTFPGGEAVSPTESYLRYFRHRPVSFVGARPPSAHQSQYPAVENLSIVRRRKRPSVAQRCRNIDGSFGGAGEAQFEIGPMIPEPFRDSELVTSQLDAADHDVRRDAAVFEQPDRLVSGSRLQHLVPATSQIIGERHADQDVLFGEYDRAGSGGSIGLHVQQPTSGRLRSYAPTIDLMCRITLGMSHGFATK